MKKIFVLFLSVVFCSVQLVEAQSKKVSAALQQLTASEFMVTFDSLANVVEEAGRYTKSNSDPNDHHVMLQLQVAYDASVQRFNAVLLNMKTDLLDSKKVKAMSIDPQVYSDSYKYRLNEASSYYEKTFLPLKHSATADSNSDIDGIVTIATVMAIIEGTYQLFKLIRQIRNEIKQFTDDLVTEQFYTPHRIKSWGEL